jgi:hypothetical protein
MEKSFRLILGIPIVIHFIVNPIAKTNCKHKVIKANLEIANSFLEEMSKLITYPINGISKK